MNRGAFAALILLLALGPVGADVPGEGLYLAFRGTVLVFPEENGLESDPAPVLPSAGAVLAYPLGGPFWGEFSLDLYGAFYGYSDALGRAVPLALENRWVSVIGFVSAFQALVRFSLNEKTALRVYGGPGADLRLCLSAADLNAAEQGEAARQAALTGEYFWGGGRWFLPVLGGGMDFALNEKWGLGFDLRVWFPLYKLWTGESLPPLEGWRFGGGIRLGPRAPLWTRGRE